MKIGFDAKRAFLNASGLGNYSRNTLNALLEYFPSNKYTLFTPKINDELFRHYERFDVISPESSVSKLFKSLWRSFSVSGQLQKHKIDLFHGLSNELPDGVHKSGVPAVVTIHDLIFMRFPEFYKPIDRKIYYRKVKYACSAASKVIAISQQTKEDLITRVHVNPEKIEVLYQSISPRYFEIGETGYLTEKYKLPKNFILSVGTIEHRKNQLTLLKAVNNANIPISVIFIGRPTLYSAELLRYITENKMEERVKFLNNIPEKDLAAFYRKAELSVYISVYEGFGLPVIESMASGCPVITSKVSCLPETAGGAAILCSPQNEDEIGKQIKKLLENNTFRAEIVKKGTERAKLFHPDKYAQNLISFYSKII